MDLKSKLTYEDIHIQFHTGRFIRDYSSQDKKAGRYRSGMMTKIGDLEETEWILYAEELIQQNGDEDLFENLKKWYRKNCKWLRGEKELHRYTLECFISGIQDNPQWCDYVAFNSLYRPELV